VDDLDAPVLTDADRHHLVRVLRLRVGAPITLADGRGAWRTARLSDPIEPTGPTVTLAPANPRLTVGFALVKGDKPELIVQKLTELGIDRIVPMRAARSVVRWDDEKAAKAVARLRVVARAAAMQCHRPDLPEIAEVLDVARLAGEPGAAMAQRDGQPPTLAHPTVLVGPEGGWDPVELQLDVAHVAFAGHVLRAETAAVAAGTVLSALRAQLVGPVDPLSSTD
jgi:16S rRNA (uracil1498-N3)-methyltransferase